MRRERKRRNDTEKRVKKVMFEIKGRGSVRQRRGGRVKTRARNEEKKKGGVEGEDGKAVRSEEDKGGREGKKGQLRDDRLVLKGMEVLKGKRE